MEFRDSPSQISAKHNKNPKKHHKNNNDAPVTASIELEKVKFKPKNVKRRSFTPYVYGFTLALELILAIRLYLSLTNVQPSQSGVIGLFFTVGNPLTRPFYDLFNYISPQPTALLIFTSMVVYGLFGWGLGRLVHPIES